MLGTSVSVYGLFTWGNIGTLTATYTLDGGTPVVGTYLVTTSSQEYIDGNLERSNFRFFLLDSLSAGNHTLVINVTQCQNHTFVFDFVTYTPSFSNLASMPSLVFTPPASTSAPALTTASHVSPTASLASQTSASSRHTPVGTIVGGAVGGLGLLALVFIPLIVFWLRRRKAEENLNLPSPFGLASEGRPESVSLVHLSVFLMELYSLGLIHRFEHSFTCSIGGTNTLKLKLKPFPFV